MSEGVFLLPRNTAVVGLVDSPSLAFGTAGQVISAKPGCLYQMHVVNKAATVYLLQFFNSSTAPVNGATPVWEVRLPASGEADVNFQLAGKYFAAGISVAISSTAGVLTLALANDAVGYARYTSAG